MKNKINPALLEEAKKLKNYSDDELLALSLGENDKWGENYKMEMNNRLKKSLDSLNFNINSLKKSMSFSSWVMGIMTFIILGLTGVLVWMTMNFVYKV